MSVATADPLVESARLFDALSDPVRLKIFVACEPGTRCVRELQDVVGKRQQAVSHHLKILRLRGYVVQHREGKENRYALSEAGRKALSLVPADRPA